MNIRNTITSILIAASTILTAAVEPAHAAGPTLEFSNLSSSNTTSNRSDKTISYSFKAGKELRKLTKAKTVEVVSYTDADSNQLDLVGLDRRGRVIFEVSYSISTNGDDIAINIISEKLGIDAWFNASQIGDERVINDHMSTEPGAEELFLASITAASEVQSGQRSLGCLGAVAGGIGGCGGALFGVYAAAVSTAGIGGVLLGQIAASTCAGAGIGMYCACSNEKCT